ncbi:MAG: type II toxin-antitoxin system VapC family toxin [Magnetococcales bacterium]|nr:type II toxin-antitoxin system VapC family toxin [Magnetococcales bacterium]
MSPPTCLLDTNVLIDYLARHPEVSFIRRVEHVLVEGAAVSIITTIELLGWRGHTDQSRLDARNLLRGVAEIPLSRMVANQVIALRERFAIKLPDAIIAASAMVEDLPLMTRNLDDFRRIETLRLINPFEGAG